MILPHTGERQGARKRYLLVVRLMLPLGLGFLNSAAGPAQSPTKLSFEAASVKVVKPGDLSDLYGSFMRLYHESVLIIGPSLNGGAR